MVLWRYNQLDPFQGATPHLEHIEILGLSFHRAKGLEADYTILLDVSEGDYGVPSQIEDDELLNLVMPRPETFEYAEERRLFYVALTRASRGVFLLTNSREPSRYIRELSEIAGDNLRFETSMAAFSVNVRRVGPVIWLSGPGLPIAGFSVAASSRTASTPRH